MKKKLLHIKTILFTSMFIVMNYVLTFATAPDKSKVESVAVDGIEMFFGALGGIAVVLGGVEFVQAAA